MHTIQRLRRSRRVGTVAVLLAVALGLVGNAVCFYYFEKPVQPEITWTDSLWYSVISITTIGYGDFSATTTGGRLATIVFIILIGLSAFSALLGLIVDGMMQLNFRELHGLARVLSKNHVLIINFPDPVRVEQIIRELRRDPEYTDCDVVVVTDRLETLPFDLPNVFFVKGSPLQLDTLDRAGLKEASMAIVLAVGNQHDSDGLVAAVLNLIEHIKPDIKTIAECLDERHEILFRSTRCDSVVYSRHIANNLIVQETQDEGIASLVNFLTGNTGDTTLYSCRVAGNLEQSYAEVAKRLIDSSWRLLAVKREARYHLDLAELNPQQDDLVIYIGDSRNSWGELIRHE